jgi:AcrR family transcriptional regulator
VQYPSDDTRFRLLDAAEALAREGGLTAISMRSIAQRVGLSAPAAYRHFTSKEALVEAMIGRGQERFLSGLRAARQGADGPESLLQRSLRYYLGFWLDDPLALEFLAERAWRDGGLSGASIADGSFGDLPELAAAALGPGVAPPYAARAGRWLAASLYGMALSLAGDGVLGRGEREALIESALSFAMGALRELRARGSK